MYLLDTNVVSELRKARAGKVDRHVAAWASGVPVASLFLSVVAVQELEMGVLLTERRDPAQGRLLRTWLEAHVLRTFAERILPIDAMVARCSARLPVPDPWPVRDALIAATGLVHGMTVVTRHVADFEPTGVAILNRGRRATRSDEALPIQAPGPRPQGATKTNVADAKARLSRSSRPIRPSRSAWCAPSGEPITAPAAIGDESAHPVTRRSALLTGSGTVTGRSSTTRLLN